MYQLPFTGLGVVAITAIGLAVSAVGALLRWLGRK